ncbi:MAG: TldD/PmbA family protein [Pseudomonadota bacterium]
MTHDLESLTARLLDVARRAGADAADAMALHGASVSIDVRHGRLEQAERADGTEIGLRVLVGRRQATVGASDISDRTVAALAERAVAMAREAPEDASLGLADPGELSAVRNAEALELSDPGPEPKAAELEQSAREAEAAALAVPGVSQTEGASARHSRQVLHIAMTNGFSGGYARTSTAISATAITGEGTAMERDHAWEARVRRSDLPDPAGIGRLAGERTVARRGARKPPTGAFPVLFDERVASGLIAHLLAAVNGGAVVRGSSWLRGRLGSQVLPASLSILEEPHRPRIFGSRPFDDEGLRTAPRAIVRDGILAGWTLDLGTARRLGMQSTAAAMRGPSSPPSPGHSNIRLTPGTATRGDLIRDMGTGLVVTSMLGASVNPTTGDYSRGAAGFWVEDGQIAWPVNECTVAGNLIDMLMRITPANDGREYMGHVVPSLLVEGLTIAGK